MFTTGQKVTCIDSNNQPTLSEGAQYTVREVGERGIRVNKEDGTAIRYEFGFHRFEAMADEQPVVRESWDEYFFDTYPNFSNAKGVLVIDDTAYKVLVEWDSMGDHFVLSGIKRLG